MQLTNQLTNSTEESPLSQLRSSSPICVNPRLYTVQTGISLAYLQKSYIFYVLLAVLPCKIL
jgi:hypothetical protein